MKTLVRLAYNNGIGANPGLPTDHDFLCPWVFPLGQGLLSSNSSASRVAIELLAGFTKTTAEQVLELFAA